VVRAERQEVRLTVTLQMWKLPSVKSFRHDSRGDSRPGCPAEQSSAVCTV
jgi:hypothetical protein